MLKVLVLYYSMYGHVHRMAEAVAEGIREVEGVGAELRRVPETLPPDVLEKLGATEAQRSFSHVPTISPKEIGSYDAIVFGTPTRFGNMCGQMRQFLDATGSLWSQGALIGKIGSVFTSSGTQHGGQESTILSFHITLLHHGMLIAGLPYSYTPQKGIEQVNGCSPYGASTIAGPDNRRMPSAVELDAARFQGRYVATLVKRMSRAPA